MNEFQGPGAGGGQQVETTMPLVLSILTTVLCCLPLGVVGIIFAAMAMSKNTAGDYAGAAESARKSKLFSFIGIGIGVVGIVLYVLLVVVLGVGAAAAGTAGAAGTP